MPETTTFYFVRHGQTDHNLRGIVQGRGVDAELNTTGHAQAEAVAQRLADVPLDAMYASTLRRAMQTAEVIAQAHTSTPLHFEADLEEMAWGVFEGAPITQDVRQMLDAVYQRWRNGAYDYRIDGGESIVEVQERGHRVVQQLLKRHRGETVLVVTHGRFLRVLLATLLEEYGLRRMHEIKHANTAVNVLTWRDGRFSARLLNCTAHLDTRALAGTG